MSRYIDADKIEYKHIVVFPDREDENSVYKSEIDAMPTADVVEVVHGEWIRDVRTPPFANSKCSNCGKTYGLYPLGYNYCPNCGARMDGSV